MLFTPEACRPSRAFGRGQVLGAGVPVVVSVVRLVSLVVTGNKPTG